MCVHDYHNNTSIFLTINVRDKISPDTKCRILVYDANVYETHKIATGGKRKRSFTSVSMGLRNKNESVASHIKCRQLPSRTPMGRELDRSDVFK